jgi:hypothetical protein
MRGLRRIRRCNERRRRIASTVEPAESERWKEPMAREFMKMVALSLTSLLLLVAAALVNSGRL